MKKDLATLLQFIFVSKFVFLYGLHSIVNYLSSGFVTAHCADRIFYII